MAPPRWQITSLDPIGALVNFAFLLVLGFSVGYVVERWIRKREATPRAEGKPREPLQFTLKHLLSLTVIVSVMFGVLATKPSLWSNVVMWLFAALVGFGVLCVLIAIVDLGRWVMGRTKTQPE